jgi:redox-sensitive bicupin YhaK (pirin superfamily)
VFLDLFETDMRTMSKDTSMHPHFGHRHGHGVHRWRCHLQRSRGRARTIGYGGVEWMRAGSGVWHGQELSAGASATVQGSSFGLHCPLKLENGDPESQYIEANAMARVGPAHVIVGAYGG